jgi:hypothetical protein
MEESNEEGSQLIRKDKDEKNAKTQNEGFILQRKETDFRPNCKPTIKDVTTNDDDIEDDMFNGKDSKVLERSKIDKEVPEKQMESFEETEEQISFDAKIRSRRLEKGLKKQTSLTEQEREDGEARGNENDCKDRSSAEECFRKSKSFEDYNIDGLEIVEIDSSSKAQEPSLEASSKKLNINNLNNESNHSDKNNNSSYDSEMPRFGFETSHEPSLTLGDRQGKMLVKNDLEENVFEESFCLKESAKSQSRVKTIPESLPLKIDKFKPTKGPLTAEIYGKIEKSSYCSLIAQAIEDNPSRLEELMESFLPEVLN